MNQIKDVQSMTSFRDHSAEIIQHLKATGRPVLLTVNGEAVAVLQDAAAYQRLLDLASKANAEEGIRQGQQDMNAGKTRMAHEAFAEIRAEYGIPR